MHKELPHDAGESNVHPHQALSKRPPELSPLCKRQKPFHSRAVEPSDIVSEHFQEWLTSTLDPLRHARTRQREVEAKLRHAVR